MKEQLIEIVKQIMQSGADVALGGDVFKSSEENKQLLEEEYANAVQSFPDQILALFSKELLECLPEEKIECVLTEGTKKYNKNNGYPEDYCPPNENYVGWNEYKKTLLQNLTSKGIIK